MRKLLLLLPLLLTPSAACANEQSIIDRINAERSSQAEQQIRQRQAKIKAHNERWRKFECEGLRPDCSTREYDWKGWKRNGIIYTTTRQSPPWFNESGRALSIGISEKISVNCQTFQLRLPEARMTSGYSDDPVIQKRFNELDRHAQRWRLPQEGPETEMVAALCSERHELGL